MTLHLSWFIFSAGSPYELVGMSLNELSLS
jgi:hypothetical protein